MNDTLKAAGRIGAELGAAKAEVERLREALHAIDRRNDSMDRFDSEINAIVRAALSRQADHVRDAAQMMVPSEIIKAIAWGDRDDAAEAIGSLRCLLADPEGEDEIAFPDSPEPTDTYTAVDMATAAAQGFRDGQAAVEPAPAQYELLSGFCQWYRGKNGYAPYHPRGSEGAEAFAAGAEWQRTRPAQTEQQPAYVECRECTDCGHVGINDAHQTDATCAMCDWSGPSPVEDQCPDCGKENVMGAACPKCSGRYRILAETHVAAPIAQTALSAVTAERDRLQAALSAPDTIKAEPAGDYANLRKQFMSLNALANSNAKMVKYWRDQCGHEIRETLLANAANVNAERDTNALLTDSLEAAEAERDRLRAKVERYVPLHEAIQRAAGELPEGWAIQLYIERNGGGVELIGPDGTEDFATNNERLDYTVIDALEAAMAAKEA